MIIEIIATAFSAYASGRDCDGNLSGDSAVDQSAWWHQW